MLPDGPRAEAQNWNYFQRVWRGGVSKEPPEEESDKHNHLNANYARHSKTQEVEESQESCIFLLLPTFGSKY
eukprot:g1582.t1